MAIGCDLRYVGGKSISSLLVFVRLLNISRNCPSSSCCRKCETITMKQKKKKWEKPVTCFLLYCIWIVFSFLLEVQFSLICRLLAQFLNACWHGKSKSYVVNRWLLSNRIILIFLHSFSLLIIPRSSLIALLYHSTLSNSSDFTISFLLPLITVISELEGLSRGIKPLTSTSGIVVSGSTTAPTTVNSSRTIGNRTDPQHAAFVAKASKEALEFLKSMHPAVKYEKKTWRDLLSTHILTLQNIFQIRHSL